MAKSINKRLLQIESIIDRAEKKVRKPQYIKYPAIQIETETGKLIQEISSKVFDVKEKK